MNYGYNQGYGGAYPAYGQPAGYPTQYTQAYSQPGAMMNNYQQPAMMQNNAYAQPNNYMNPMGAPMMGAYPQQQGYTTGMSGAAPRPTVLSPPQVQIPSPPSNPQLHPYPGAVSSNMGRPLAQSMPTPQPQVQYIAPANKPVGVYIPPPKLPHRFPFDPDKMEAYANFYSILSAMEALEEETCNGIISQEQRNELFAGLFEQYNRVLKVIGFGNQNDVKEFALATDLICSFTFASIFGNTEQNKQTQAANKAVLYFDIGQGLTTLSDLCESEGSMYGQCQQAALEIRTKFRKLGEQGNDNAIKILTKWIQLFMQKKTSDPITANERRDLAKDIVVIRNIVAMETGQ
ncbi:hypothetical protein GPJ56_001272 [Histomonas meleagridis]|uniref:uncharacterized protein n=1 Tax=Histomonas meleagridis TaxID=135588 RepID=UPI00355ABF6E|nr:hypothetical protein GPJ56_001272 [Histomonas meleagridis]KAH0805029.1 hypothetical protein GO595_001974 [Histomonas meleagridis]